MTQVVNVNAQATSHSTAELTVRLHFIRKEIENSYRNSKDLPKIRKKIDLLEGELTKTRPDKSELKKIIKWSLNTGRSLFLKIAPIIVDKLLSPTS
jgi:hypothetical protein